MKPYYEDSSCQIFLGDCREILPQLPKVDLVLTDPPYGVTRNKWDNSEISLAILSQIESPIVCTSQQPFSAQLITRLKDSFKWSDVWKKSQSVGFLNARVMPLRQHEDVLVFCSGKMIYNPQFKNKPKHCIRPATGRTSVEGNYGNADLGNYREVPNDISYPTSIIEIPNEQGTEHPTQKPLALFIYLTLTFSNECQSILDPFMGSGTTLVAAKQLGRRAIGIELEEKYCEIAAKRLQQEYLPLNSVPEPRMEQASFA